MTVCTNDNVRPDLAVQDAVPAASGSSVYRFLALAVYGVTTLWSAAEELYARFQNRRGVEAMLKLDDSILHDMGVTRADVRWASRLPLSYRAGEELSRASGRRLRRSRG